MSKTPVLCTHKQLSNHLSECMFGSGEVKIMLGRSSLKEIVSVHHDFGFTVILERV